MARSEVTTVHEVERSYAMDPGAPLPPLRDLPGVAGLSEPRTSALDATYWDTADLRLAARAVRLRRRTGGADAGWHLKLPGPSGTTEVHAPAGRGARPVPAALRALVTSLTRGAPLGPVARLRTRRVEVDLLDPDGQVLATVADDDASGQRLATDEADGAALDRWREVEVELSTASPDGLALLDAAEARLVAAGARPARHPAKVVRVLGPAVPPPWPPLPQAPAPRAPAHVALLPYLREQVDAIVTQDPRVRRDEEDAVHKMRVGTRRLRSTLRTFRPLFDRATVDRLGAELRWLAGVLGGMRDREVLLARLLGDVGGLPPEMVLGPVAARLDSTLTADMAKARREALRVLDGERYRRLLDDLTAFAADPPVTDRAALPARDVLPTRVARVHRRLSRELDHAHQAEQPAVRDEAFHEARKVAKRLRYAGEALAAGFGADARRIAVRAEALQEVLGEHQDSVVTRGVLREMALAAYDAGENAFTYGVLVGVESARAAAVEAQVPAVWHRLDTRKARRLLR